MMMILKAESGWIVSLTHVAVKSQTKCWYLMYNATNLRKETEKASRLVS